MKIKLFVLFGLVGIVLTSIFFANNVFATQAVLTTDITNSMHIGDFWSISFTGLNAGEKVYVTGGKVFNGIVANTPVLMGTADANGNLNLCGMHYPNVVGNWQTNWTRQDGTSIKSLNFSVLSKPFNGGTVDTYQYEDYTVLALTDRSPFPFPKDAIGAYPFNPLPYGVLSPDPTMQNWYIAVLTAAQKIDPNATISRKIGIATVTVNGRPINLTGMMKGTLITSEQINQVLASTPPPACGVSTRSMTAAEIVQFKKDNPDYVNPYLIFTSSGIFGDPANWTYQQHYWYDPTYTSNTGQQCPGSYCWGAADAHRDPFTDIISEAPSSQPGRVDSKGSFYYVFDAGTSYSFPGNDRLWSIQIIPPYMSPSALVQKLERAAYSPNTSLTTTEYLAYERALSVYIKKAVDAYIAPKLPTYVPEPAPIPSGTVITGEAYNTYWNQTNANKAWRKAATTAVINAVQQIQLQMGSASDQQTTSRAFISQWNKDPVPALVTTPRTTPTTTPITTPGSEPGCTSAGPYSTTTGRLCATSSVVPGCIPGYLFSPLSGNPCNTISVSSASNILSNNWYYRNFSYSSSDEDSATSDSSTDPTLVCTGSETTATCHPEWSVAGSLCNASTMSGACSPDRVNPYAAATLAKKVVAQGKAKGNTIFCSAKYTPFRPSIDPSTGLSYYYNTTCEVNGTAGIDAKTLVR